MKSIQSFIAASVVCISYASPAWPAVLERTAVGELKVEMLESNSKIHVSGIVKDSSCGVKEVSTQQKGRDMIILVRLSYINALKLPADFNSTLAIPPGTSRVLFGKKNAVIWDKETGVQL